jgi:hypothetical protein
MSFAEEIERQGRVAARPSSPTDLLLHHISGDPHAKDAAMETDWAKEHAAVPRFYVGGLSWFLELTLLNAEKLAAYRDQAPRDAKKIDWHKMAGTPGNVVKDLQGQWGAISRQQYYSVLKSRAVNFPKAALFLLSCELALQSLIDAQQARKHHRDEDAEPDSPRIPKTITAGHCIYQRMAIIPACWNINDFNAKYIERHVAFKSSFLDQLAKHAKQSDATVFSQLASGYTVTFRTANCVKAWCEKNGCEPLGKIRCRAGKNLLGTKKAADLEELEP